MTTFTKPSSPSKTNQLTRPLAAARDDSAYASPEETRALMASSQAVRANRLAASDMVSTDQAAEFAGVSRVTINAWITKGRCIGLSQVKRGFKLPVWQFDPVLWDAIPKLSAGLGVKEGWALLSFLESPNAALDGITPRAAIEQGQIERVLAVAEGEGNT